MINIFPRTPRATKYSENFKFTRNTFYYALAGFILVALFILWFNHYINYNTLLSTLSASNLIHIPLSSTFRSHGNKYHPIVQSLYTSNASLTTINKMSNFFNKMYTGSLTIGSPSQHFDHIVFDTGSADLWVLSKNGENIPNKDYLNYYTSSKSTTYNGPVTTNWSITYGSGGASGKTGKDTITIAGLTVSEQMFAEATTIQDMSITEYEPQDGICGFARQSASTLNTPTLMESLRLENINPSGIFSFYLSKHSDIGSKLLIGDPTVSSVKSYYNGDINYFNLASSYGYSVGGLWALPLEYIIIGNKNLTFSSTQYVIFDTGTSYVGIPSQQYSVIMNLLTKDRSDCISDSSNDDIYTCTDTINPSSNLPKMSFNFRNSSDTIITYGLNGDDYLDDDGELGFMPLDINIWILGDTFLKNYFSVYDEQNSLIGLADSNYNDSELSSLMETILIVAAVIVGILLCLATLRCYVTKKQSEYFNNHSLLQPH